MNETILRNEDKLLEEGIKILFEKFGAVDTNRFIAGLKEKREESLNRHKKWQSKLEKDTFLKEIFD